jgi:uncharacterized tellurite resistance protein B-like protein
MNDMDKIFKKILFKTAFCCMACDGHIDEKEIEEMKKMDKNTTYFGDVNLSGELDLLIDNLNKHGKKVVNDLFNELKETRLNPVQELLLLEVALRIIHSDERIDENELKFLRLLRGKLGVFDEIIVERFGKNNLLFDKSYNNDVKISETEFVDRLELPNYNELIDMKVLIKKNGKI